MTVPPIVDHVRAIARAHGWAIGVHGSLARDIDMIATPWTVDATPWQGLLDAIRIGLNLDEIGTHQRSKPHGRIGVLLTQKGAVYERTPKGTWHPPCLDVSIVDPRPDV